MNRLIGLVWMLLLPQDQCEIHEPFGSVEVRRIYVYKCISAADLKFDIIRVNENQTQNTIAECESTHKVCYLSNISLGRFYAVNYIGKGGQLSILEDNSETRGRYKCCHTYNSSRCVQLNATLPDSNTSSSQSREEIQDHFNNNPGITMKNDFRRRYGSYDVVIRICSIIICVVAVIFLLVYILFNTSSRLCPTVHSRDKKQKKHNKGYLQNGKGKEEIETAPLKEERLDEDNSDI